MGFTFASLLPGFANSVVTTVAYPAFCELHRRGEALGGTLMQLQEMMAVLLFPLAFGVSAVAEGAITLLYGDRWQGLGTVIGWLAVLPGLFNLWGLNGEAYRAMGRPDIWAKLVGAGLVVMFPLLWLAGPLGLVPFTIARFAGAALLPLLNIFGCWGCPSCGNCGSIPCRSSLRWRCSPPLVSSCGRARRWRAGRAG
jgi:O-antigen/teichoic acid export membrane protein